MTDYSQIILALGVPAKVANESDNQIDALSGKPLEWRNWVKSKEYKERIFLTPHAYYHTTDPFDPFLNASKSEAWYKARTDEVENIFTNLTNDGINTMRYFIAHLHRLRDEKTETSLTAEMG